MGITYTDEKKFTKEQTQQLFRSVGWVSGKYPERLYKALMGSSTVFSAWDGDRLVGLVRVLDDTEMVAYMHYVLVDPEYQGHGIAGHLVGMVKERYRDYLYIEVMPEESKNATFYQKHGFSIMEDGAAMQNATSVGKAAFPAPSAMKSPHPNRRQRHVVLRRRNYSPHHSHPHPAVRDLNVIMVFWGMRHSHFLNNSEYVPSL